MVDRAGSVEDFFLEGHDPSADDVEGGLDSFSTRALALDLKAAYGRVPRRPGVCYFFPRPSAGSACKRLNLFLRWMVRRDALDLGVWRRVSPAMLVVPLDTHVIRVGRCLRLTAYTSPGWRMARDITASLRRLDPEDPVKYDYALCHLGMMNACGFGRAQADSQCPLRGVCRPEQKVEVAVEIDSRSSAGLRRKRGRWTAVALAPAFRPAKAAAASRAGYVERPRAVDLRRLLDHPLDGEALADAREAGFAHPLPQRLVLQRADDRARQRRVIARRHEQPVDLVLDDLGNAAGAGRDNRRASRPSRRAATCPGPR